MCRGLPGSTRRQPATTTVSRTADETQTAATRSGNQRRSSPAQVRRRAGSMSARWRGRTERRVRRTQARENEASGCSGAGDELFDLLSAYLVAVLLRRRLHEVRRWAEQRAADAAVERDLRAANRVDDDASGV